MSNLLRGIGLTGEGMLELTGPVSVALLSLPVLTGISIGYGKEKFNTPSKGAFRNVGDQMLLSELKKQLIQTRRRKELWELERKRGQFSDQGTGVTSAAEREIHV